MEHCKLYESPSSFWKWSAYTTIAATLRDNCYRRLGDNRVYPNIYTLLLADSAVHRKGYPVRLCEELIRKVKSTKLISGRSSIQGILDELSRGETDKSTGKLTAGGSALFSAAELSAGLVNDPEAIKILTDIYDFKDEYTSRLRGSGIFRIKNVCFTMMAASNESLLRDVYDEKALRGGLLGRTFLIKPDEFRKGNSLFEIQDTTVSFEAILAKLTRISILKGEFDIEKPAERFYDDWYIPFRDSYKSKPDKSGVIGRIHTGVLKLAMIICVNETESLVILREHIEKAIGECMRLMPNYSGLIMSSGKSTIAETASVLIEEIWKSPNKCLKKSEFLSRHFHQFDLESVDKCTQTLAAAGLLKEIFSGNEIQFEVTEKCIKSFDLKEGS